MTAGQLYQLLRMTPTHRDVSIVINGRHYEISSVEEVDENPGGTERTLSEIKVKLAAGEALPALSWSKYSIIIQAHPKRLTWIERLWRWCTTPIGNIGYD